MNDDGFIPDPIESNDGFIPDQPEQGGYFSDVAKNAGQEITDMIKLVPTAARAVSDFLYPSPEMIKQQALNTKPFNQAVMDDVGVVKDIGVGMAKDLGRTILHPFKSFREKPINTISNALLLAGGVSSLAEKAAPLASKAAENIAQGSARRSLGFTKRFLNKPGNLQRANESAQAMLDEGVITNPILHPFSSGSEAMEGRVENLMEKSGQKMGYVRNMLDANGIPGPSAKESSSLVFKELNPRFADEKRVVDEIVEDMTALGNDRLTYDDAFTVLKKLDQKAKYSPMGGPTDQLKANMYRQAYGVFRKQLDSAIERGSTMMGDFSGKQFEDYKKAKKLFGNASNAKKALTNKISSEAGNNRIGLREAAIGAAELASGHPGRAVAAIGAMEGAKRFGNAGLATVSNSVAKGLKTAPKSFLKKVAIPSTVGLAQNEVSSRLPKQNILTEEKAKEFLKQAKGDRNLARALAKSKGYSGFIGDGADGGKP